MPRRRRPQDHSHRRRATYNTRSLPDHMNGTLNPIPPAPTVTYPTITIDDEDA